MNSVARDLKPLLAPASIAVIGASNNPFRIGGFPLVHLSAHELNTYNRYGGAVYPVNPKYKEVFGRPCFAEIENVPGPVDLAIIALPAEQVLDQLERCHARGIPAAMVFAAGYAETNEAEGQARQARLQAFVERSGMRVAGPNCLGNANLITGAYSTFAGPTLFAPRPGVVPRVGRVALLAQSGNMCATSYLNAQTMGVGVNYVINTGNEAGVEFSEYLRYLLEDDQTDAVIGYIEQLRNGPAFLATARGFQRKGKMLAMLKAGRSAKGAEATQSHTAAVAGDYQAFETACQQAGVIVAEDLQHLAACAYLTRFIARPGKRAAVVTMSGAAGALLSDSMAAAGLDLPTLPPEVQSVLRAHIPSYGMVANPVDVTGNIQGALGSEYSLCHVVVKNLLECDQVDMVVLYMPGIYLDHIAKDLIQLAATTSKLIAVVDLAPQTPETQPRLEQAGIAWFDDIPRSVRALASVAHWARAAGDARVRPEPSEPSRNLVVPAAALDILQQAHDEGATVLDEALGKQLLRLFELPVVAEHVVTSASEAAEAAQALGFPVVVKVLSPDLPHKSEVGGVRLNIDSPRQAASAFDEVLANARRHRPHARLQGAVVQTMARGEHAGAELLVGITTDPVFGKMLTVGLGGVWVELFKDTAHRLLPITPADAGDMLRELKSYPLLRGFRGSPALDVAAAAEVIARLGHAALALGPQVTELEVNPVLLGVEGKGALIVDALVSLAPVSRIAVSTPLYSEA